MQLRKVVFGCIFAFANFLISTSFGATPVKEVVLNNGLKVLLLEDHKSPTVTFQVWYRVGSRNEIDGKSGLSHFLEHMMRSEERRVGKEGRSRWSPYH